MQIATALILVTGANTPFTGFPFLANFVAEDSFLPRQLTRRGHRLAFSNGIVILTLLSIVLLIVGKANVDKLVPFYSLGVFTGFTLAGFGMAKYHTIHKQPGWKQKWWINASGGGLSLTIVVITAVVKFTEGAWLVLVLAPIMWLVLMRLNQQYRDEARALDLVTNALGKGAALPQLPPPRRAGAGRPAGPRGGPRAALRRQPAADRAARGAHLPRRRPGGGAGAVLDRARPG